MFAKHHYILLGILSLSLSYVMFTGQQYFSQLAMAGLFALALIATVLFIAPHINPKRMENHLVFYGFIGAIVILGLFEYLFNLALPQLLLRIGYEALLLGIATCISIA